MSDGLFWNHSVSGRRTLGACFAEALDVTTSLLTDIVQGNIELLHNKGARHGHGLGALIVLTLERSRFLMTEDIRKAIDSIRKGNPIECSAHTYRKIRATIILFALDCADSDDTDRMQTALAEVKRLDKQHSYGRLAESPNSLIYDGA